MASFTPASATELESSTEIGITYTGIDGLTIGLASGTDGGAGLTSEVENQTMYVTYAYDAFTFGIQDNESDSEVADADEEYRAYAVSYAVNDALSLSYNRYDSYRHNNALGTNSGNEDSEQSITAFNIGYTIGGMTIGFQEASTDNAGWVKDAEDDSRTLGISVAF